MTRKLRAAEVTLNLAPVRELAGRMSGEEAPDIRYREARLSLLDTQEGVRGRRRDGRGTPNLEAAFARSRDRLGGVMPEKSIGDI
jgi:hypothetical protein